MLLSGVTFDVAAGSLTTLIGPNGAGKTTCLNCISRLCEPASGDVRLDGDTLLRRPPYGLARLGVARTFQQGELFASMTAIENVLAGVYARRCAAPSEREARRDALEALEAFGLAGEADRGFAAMPLSMRKRVELARALATKPRLLLLDEPLAGQTGDAAAALFSAIDAARHDLGATVLMVEHNVPAVMRVSDQVVVLDAGRVAAAGTPTALREASAGTHGYLGAL